MTYFISYHKIDDAMNIIDLFLRKVVWLHGVQVSIVSDHNVMFFSYFGRFLLGKLGTKFLFFTTCHPQTMILTQLSRVIIQINLKN